MGDIFRTLVENSDLLKRSDLQQLLRMSIAVNSMLNNVIGKQADQFNKKEKGAPAGVPSDNPVRLTDFAAKPRDIVPFQKELLLDDKVSGLVRCPEESVQQPVRDDWEQIARKNQLIPEGDWRIWLLLAGRGFGKTRAAAEAIRKLALSGKYKRIALIGNTIEEAKQVMVEGVSGLQNISQDSDGLTYTPSRRELRWKNGAIATLYGAENYQQLRGPQFDLAWVDEFAKFLYPRETFEQLSFALRMGDDPKLILTTTPRPIPFIKELMARDDVVMVRGSSLENEKNLSPTFLKHLEYLKGTRLEAQEMYAEIVEDNPNALWAWRDIENCYRDPPHFMENIVIGVDPATTGGKHSDETGMIVVGKDFNDRAFVLEDASMRAAPNIWARKVADLYKRYRAKKIVIETNAGGDLLDEILLREDSSLNIKKVRAKESKICRAQPVVILYQKNLVFHAKQFRELEMEMVTYEPGQKSPDRMDALVWALTDLFEIEASSYAPRAFLI